MLNLNRALNERISRLARKEIKGETGVLRRATAQYRRDIAALKRQVGQLQKTIAFLEKQEKRRVSEPGAALPQKDQTGMRFRADGLRSHRSKLGLSAKDYGRLVGVSGLTVYHWEGGKSRPRKQQLEKLAAVRGLGKREADKRLELLNGK